MNYVFVINPLAGNGSLRNGLPDKIRALDLPGPTELYYTKAEADASAFVRGYCNEHGDTEIRFISCGGDGTLSEVVGGAVGFPNASVTCYPCGSGNDFVKTWGGASRFLDLRELALAPDLPVDLLKVGDFYSLNVVNFGLDAFVAIQVQDYRARYGHGSKSAYTRGVLKALVRAMHNRFTVRADGELMNPEGGGILCTIANGQYVGGSYRCAPRALTDDGFAEVCIVKEMPRPLFITLIGGYMRGEHLDRRRYKDHVIYRRAKRIEVDGPEGFAYTRDGEIVYESHFTVEVCPKMIRFAIPERK